MLVNYCEFPYDLPQILQLAQAAFFSPSHLKTLIWYYFKTGLNGECLLLEYECIMEFSKYQFWILFC